MKTPAKFALALLIAAAISGPALADKGGNGNGNANGHDKSDSSNGNNGNGNGGGNGNGNNGNGNGNGGSNGNTNNGNGNGAVSDEVVAVPDDQKVVQKAVSAKAALSLEAITAIVQGDTSGRILDVQLVTFKGTYLYDVTVLEKDGVLHKLYYNARSGRRVRTN